MKKSALRMVVVAGVLALLAGVGGAETVNGMRPPATAAAAAGYRVIQETPERLLVELPNRLIVLVQEIHTSPVVSAQVWVKTGSIYEQEHVGAGLSHYLEHLLAGGTTVKRTEADTNKLLGKIGAETNAMTDLDSVHYYVNTTRPFAAEAVDLVSDWMLNTQINQKEFEREREVIRNEFAMGEGEPGRVFWKLTQTARYVSHPARHPTIGYLDEFNKITREQVVDFYHRMYVPNNMVFVVVGDVDKAKVVEQVAGLWKDAKAGDLPKLSFPVEPELTSPREASGQADINLPQVRLAWPGTQLGRDEDYALDLLGMILGQGESSRLVRELRDKQQLVTGIAAYNYSFHWGKGYFGIDAQVVVPPMGAADVTANEKMAAAIQGVKLAALKEVEAIKKDGVTAAELARAKRQTLAQATLSTQTAEGTAERMAEDVIGMGDPDYVHRYAAAIQKVTAEEVKAAANKYLDANKLITVSLTVMPEGQKVAPLTRPVEDPAASKFARAAVDLDNQALVKKVEAATATGAVKSEAGKDEGVARFTLPNGLRVLVGRSTRVPAVAIEMYHLGGLLADETGKEGLASAAATMRIRGTATRSADELAREVEDLGASLATDSGNNTSYTRALCLKEDWKKVLGLVADVTLNPAFSEAEWWPVKQRTLEAIKSQRDTWDGELVALFLEAYYGKHPWSVTAMGRQEAVEKFTAKDLKKFYTDHLGASEAVLAIFGDVDVEEVKKEVEAAFGKMPAKPAVAFAPQEPAAAQTRFVPVVTKKNLAAVEIGFGPGVKRTSPDFAAMQVLARVLSSFPSGWLETELRGQGGGLVYAVGASQVSGVEPGYLGVLFNTQPAQVMAALEGAMKQMNRIRTSAPTGDDLARAKAAVLTGQFMNKQSNSDRATEAAINELLGLPLDESERFMKAVQAVSAEDIGAAAQKHLRTATTILISNKALTDEEKKKAEEITKPGK